MLHTNRPDVHTYRTRPGRSASGERLSRSRKGQRGIALIEVAIAFPIVLIALGMFVQMLSSGAALRLGGSEAWTASTAAQGTIERMRNEDIRQVIALFDSDPLNDIGGPGTARGHRFAVPGLTPLASAADGMVGEIFLPLLNVGSEVAPRWEVREDLVDDALGMPRDLTGDAVIDANDHSDDYTLVPVLVVLRWQGRRGPRELRMHTILCQLR